MNKALTIAVVDGCSTGTLIAQEFNRQGFRCIHIQSSLAPPTIMTGAGAYHPHEYAASLVHHGDVQATAKSVASFNPIAVIPGAEPGVELADRLAAALDLPCNAPELTSARRDKYYMVQAVAAAGLRTIPSMMTAGADVAVAWIRTNCGYPAVVKPSRSGGTDGVTLCMDDADVQAAFATLLGHQNILAIVNDMLVVQAYMRGIEYIVDTVSCDGVHHVTDIWEYGKRPSFGRASFVYDHAWLLPGGGTVQAALTAYAARALDALGIRHGAAHCEIMISDGTPVLIEVGARICGGYVPVLCKAALGQSQVDALVDSVKTPATFKANAATTYQLQRQALRVLLLSDQRGILRGLPLLHKVHTLPSFHAMQLGVQVGSRIEQTTNFYSHPGKVDLIHSSRDVLANDMASIRTLEANGFYNVQEDKK